MSSSGITSINSGPIIIRTYTDNSPNKTFLLTNYDNPVSSNYVLITSSNGQLVPSNNIYVSSISSNLITVSTVFASTIYNSFISSNIAVISSITNSSILSNVINVSNMNFSTIFGSTITTSTLFCTNADITNLDVINARLSTAYLSSVFSINSTVSFYNQVNIDSNPNQGSLSLYVNGSTIFTEPGAVCSPQSANVTIWGRPSGMPIQETFTTTTTYNINSTISKINFEMIGAGGASTFSNQILANEDLPGYGAYLSGTLAVKQGDKLQFTIGQLGGDVNGSYGTSLVYISTTGPGTFVSTLVAVAGAGGGNGYSPTTISTSSGGGHGGGGNGAVRVSGAADYIAEGTQGYDGLVLVNGIYVSDTDSGDGGKKTTGGPGGDGNPAGVPNNGDNGLNPNTADLLNTGGLVTGGKGGENTYKGGWGGGGYSGGGGGGASSRTSAGGGGGATYIAISTLSEFLSNVVCLGGQFLANNNISPFGGDYGIPSNPGFAAISGYSPNDTLYTNGDIQCRVLRYEMLDPPINAIGGSSALWSLYPAIDIVNMNENPIVECGGIEVDANGIDVTGNSIFRNKLSTLETLTVASGGANIMGITSINGPAFSYISANPLNPNTFKIELGGANLSVYKGSITGPNFATFIQNTGGGQTVLATNNPILFINGAAQGNNFVGINQIDPQQQLDVFGNTNISNIGYISSISTHLISSGITHIGAISTNSISSGIIYSGLISSNIISSGTLYSNLLSSNSISSGITLSGLISSNTISSGTIYSGLISSNINSSGTIFSNLISCNTISSGTLYSNLLSSNTISSGITYSALISSNSTSTAALSANFISTNYISSGNVVNSLAALDGSVTLSGTLKEGSTTEYIGNVTISASPIGITTFDNSNIAASYDSYAVVDDPAITLINLAINTPPGNTSINLINNTNTIISVSTTNQTQPLFPSTFMNAIYYNTSWLLPFFNIYRPERYVYIVDAAEEGTTEVRNGFILGPGLYTKLDYVLVGGGGGGGIAAVGSGTPNYGGGGGGSGILKASIPFTLQNYVTSSGGRVNFNIQNSFVTDTTLSLNGVSKVTVELGLGGLTGFIGKNGLPSYIRLFNNSNNIISTVTANGGEGGEAAQNWRGGVGGNGYNGGGAGAGGSADGISGGTGQTSIGGSNGNSSRDGGDTSGEGGGLGGGGGRSSGVTGSSCGGGGGAGTSISNTNSVPTGGFGAKRADFSTDQATPGQDYTGAGGGGGAYDGTGDGIIDTFASPSRGGKGYAILYFHN
jgi:hypothetical protein